jgi:hypothetical protein
MRSTRSIYPHRTFIIVLAVATAFEGFRFGAGTFRALLDLPARHAIGALAFADFSRATDLSTRGVALYIIYGFGGFLLTAALWLMARRAWAARWIEGLTALAMVCSLAVLALTARAAPLMWRIGAETSDPTSLSRLIDRFTFWTDLRVLCADLSFAAVLTCLARLALQARTSE